ncbi:ParB/RepB/Spo0J family partition protein [Chitinophaga sancti]|uniref:ParB/RepB/Spo0J family partition protein n=1 Tax=Chitinophaga sancti TaxID=1004 RepID=A0A1K1T0C5_9BACT|nr:ParB/RepB/Spo0J family partition protein [Chitinophaga sancti]WQD65390.1 ParB/RepB/Spo0J family partition protein [Chitinophaga sancti]WQG88986.1 ParB/RepB/Spo0J family partition protein [Chitinophaga sancti]SFW89775.1 ParB/RepB/Spo0J family partition protein [Chitinophaga sancti]
MKTTRNNKKIVAAVKTTTANDLISQTFKSASTIEFISEELIDFSPMNKRRKYSKESLEQLAESLVSKDFIHEPTVRKKGKRFELVVGQRRLMAARLGGIKIIRCKVVDLDDAQVREIQLTENLQRENQHPLDESAVICEMMETGMSVAEIAHRIGKSERFVYARKSLSALIDEIKDILWNDKFTMQQAFEIATLSSDAQQAFFENCCEEWQNENFKIRDFNWEISRLRCDLTKAPFDIEADHLIPDAGNCNSCPHNSACASSLFPEFADTAICSKKSCFQKKCEAHFYLMFSATFAEHMPAAFVFRGSMPDLVKHILSQLGAEELPVYTSWEVNECREPQMPDINDYYTEDEDCTDGETFTDIGQARYEEDLTEYKVELAEYHQKLDTESVQGIFFDGQDIRPYRFFPRVKASEEKTPVFTAKEVELAIKNGTADEELLSGEVKRLNDRETRSKELDSEKVQKEVYMQSVTFFEDISNKRELLEADIVASRYLVINAMNWATKNAIVQFLFPDNDRLSSVPIEDMYNRLRDLTEAEFCYLIRITVAGNDQSKNVKDFFGHLLYKMAESAGVDVAVIEKNQKAVTQKRESRVKERIAFMNRKLTSLAAKKKRLAGQKEENNEDAEIFQDEE